MELLEREWVDLPSAEETGVSGISPNNSFDDVRDT
jgi:hypothetical protein